MKLNKLFLAIITSFSLVFISGCGSSQTELPEGTISYAIKAEPASLDPALTTGLPESNAELELFEGLTRIDKNGIPQPALAEKWEISSDGMTYRFYLREGICWSDGTPITADDFVYSWKRVLDPNTASQNAYMLFVLKNGEAYNSEEAAADDVGVRAIDERTLEVQLGEPAAYFLGLTSFHAFYPVPKHIVEVNPETWAGSDKNIVSCGPYILKKWIHSSEIIMMKNDNYWNKDNVKSPCIVMPISESAATRVNFLESGNADIVDEPPSADEARLRDLGLYKPYPMLGTIYYVFNLEKAPFDNPKVRQAFAMSLERENFVRNVVKSGKEPAYAFVPPGMIINKNDFRSGSYEKLMQENAEEARKILKESGYNGEAITLLYGTSESSKVICEGIQDMWKKNLGIEVELVNQETKVFYDSRDNGDYQIAYANWIADFSDPMNFLDIYYDPNNESRYKNPKFIELVAKAKQETDGVKRAEYMHEAEQLLIDDYVIIPLYYSSMNLVINPRIKGYFTSPMGLVDLTEAYLEN